MYRRLVVTLLMMVQLQAFGQGTDSLGRKLDSLEKRQDSIGERPNDISGEAYTERTQITFSSYFKLLGSNFKQQLTAPFHLSKKDWGTVGKFALLTGALALADRPVQKEAIRIRNSNPALQKISKVVTDFGGPYEGYTLATLAAYGFIFKNEKVKVTTLLATQAYITGGTISMALKYLTGRQRPNYYGTDTIAARATFHGPFSSEGRQHNGKSFSPAFPSGHTAVAFAAATVFAMEYRDKPVIPIIAYSAASLIGISRITENAHWATDVLVGAAIGYLSGRQVVNNYHRYAKIRNARKKGDVSFNLNIVNGQLMPAVVYRFR